MKMNVRGRDIEVHTGMANYHSKLHGEPVSEKLLVMYLNAEYGCKWEDHLRADSDEKLTATIQKWLKADEFSCPANLYDESCQGADWRL